MSFGCPRQFRPKRVVPLYSQDRTQPQQSRQTVALYQDHRAAAPLFCTTCTEPAEPLTPPPHRPPALFPHRPHQDPRGFLLPRFVNAGHHLMAAIVTPRPASKNLQGSGRSLRWLQTAAMQSKAVCWAGKPRSSGLCRGHSTGLRTLPRGDWRLVAKSNRQCSSPLHVTISSL
jgi:hypothetical protein